jgi:hypothetical protein
MKRRYSIWGTEICSDHEVELAQVDSNPQAISKIFEEMMVKGKPAMKGGKVAKIRKYTWVRIIDNEKA